MATPLDAVPCLKPEEFIVADAVTCGAAQLSARRMALAIGFSGTASEEIALAVAEMGMNLVKHAGSGYLALRAVLDESRMGIEVETSDHGPGMSDVEKSFADGYSTSGSLGYGLGTINRLMDDVDIRSTPSSGTHMVCRRWIQKDRDPGQCQLWDVGVFSRPREQALENGDAFVVKNWNGQLLTGLIDGLGHGEPAQKAALAAQQYVQSHSTQTLDKIFQGVGRACKGTRGVVMALARFMSPSHLQFASLGNIEARAWTGGERVPFGSKRGFLGAEEINVHVQEFPWNSQWLLVLHSDGLRSHWQWDDFPGIEREPAQAIAARLLRELGTTNDDATILAVRGKNR
jgi:anti-sigma regulatory factor (Ser/Thr protein kinase)